MFAPAPPPLIALASMEMGVDLFAAVMAKDAIGWVCTIILGILSVISVSLMIRKYVEIARASAQTDEFLGAVTERHATLEELFQATREYPESPVASLMRETYVEAHAEDWFKLAPGTPLETRLSIAKSSIENVLDRTITSEQRRLEHGLHFLATVSSLGPFIGLFGTVWGILGAFQALGRAEEVSIAALAPGLSTALVTTIFGLVAAIPALVMHHELLARVGHLTSRMETFGHELGNAFQKRVVIGSAEFDATEGRP